MKQKSVFLKCALILMILGSALTATYAASLGM